MTLKEYKFKTGYTFRELGAMWKIDAAQLARYANGQGLPSLPLALKIYNNSKKKIGLEDWFKPKPKKGKLV